VYKPAGKSTDYLIGAPLCRTFVIGHVLGVRFQKRASRFAIVAPDRLTVAFAPGKTPLPYLNLPTRRVRRPTPNFDSVQVRVFGGHGGTTSWCSSGHFLGIFWLSSQP
jgi:hypothetical protein